MRLREVFVLLQSALQEKVGRLGLGVEVFRASHDTELAELMEMTTSGEKRLTAYEQKLRQQTGINSLKIKKTQDTGLVT